MHQELELHPESGGGAAPPGDESIETALALREERRWVSELGKID